MRISDWSSDVCSSDLAGQIVAEGFLDLRLPFWARRMVTRLIAIIPAVVMIAIAGEGSATELLVMSQVVLSLQLPFAIVPLVAFPGDRKLMGEFVNPRWPPALAWAHALLNLRLNLTHVIASLCPEPGTWPSVPHP